MGFKGQFRLMAAPFTPINDDGSVNLEMIEKLAGSLIDNGVRGAFICGTTGEGMSLTVEERMRVAERWVEVARDDLVIIVHVGHTCLSDCKALAAHAQRIGAHAVSTSAPSFFKPSNVEDLVSFCAQVASAAPETPFYYYHIPSMTGVNLPVVEFLKLGAERIPNLEGVKFTHEDLMDFGLCVDLYDGRFNMLFGRDEILLPALSLGAAGAVGTTYNFAAPLYQGIIKAFDSGDMISARREQVRAQKMVSILLKYGGLPAGKAIMRMIGLDCGGVRPPLRDLSKGERDDLAAELQQIGFFDYCSKA